MCLGHAVRMTRCHHILYHYRTRCEQRCWEPCDRCQEANGQAGIQEAGEEVEEKRLHGKQTLKCKKGHKGEKCERATPSGPEYDLDDYCSRCDPSWKLYEARFFYASKVEEWEQQRFDGTADDELDEILAKLERNYLEVVQEIRKSNPDPHGEVAFLPCVDMTQLGLSSQYVDKYVCVWDDPPDESKTIRKVQGRYLQADRNKAGSMNKREGFASIATSDDKCQRECSTESDEIPPDDSRSLCEDSEVDWLAIADMQLDSGQASRAKPRGPRPMPEMDKLPSLLPPEMTQHSGGVDKISSRYLLPFKPSGRSSCTSTAGDAVLRWEEFQRSQQDLLNSSPHR